jgi:hypothetical protein
VNGDGLLDLATANIRANTVGLLLGQSDGSFTVADHDVVEADPVSVALGDVNRDGKPDLAVANYGGNNVSILLNKAGADAANILQSANKYSVGTHPTAVAMKDLNGDGKADLAVTNETSNTVSVLLGDGNGSFKSAVHYAVGTNPNAVAISDVNSDGKPDLIVANLTSNNVSILLGKGDGTFNSAQNFPTGSDPNNGLDPMAVAVGDLNRDGKPDLAVANFSGNTVSVLLNATASRAGVFPFTVNYPAGLSPSAVALGDLNGDGKPDLAITNSYSDSVSVLFGKGDGTFNATASAILTYTTGTAPQFALIADVSGDSKPDLIVANQASQTVSVFLNTSSGTAPLASGVAYAVKKKPSAVAVGDLNGDGKADLAVTNAGSNSVSVLLGLGSGQFDAALDFPTGAEPQAVAVGDVNRDGKPDLAVANASGDSVSVLLGDTKNLLKSATAIKLPAKSFPNSVAMADLDGDGNPDLAVTQANTDTLSVLLGKGDGTFKAASSESLDVNPKQVVVSDFSRDGKPDLAVVTANGVSVLLGRGNGKFRTAYDYFAGSQPVSVAAGDLNSDGKPDLAVANFISSNVSVLLNY